MADDLPGRVYSVTRNVLGEGLVIINVMASSVGRARQMADREKYNREVAQGFHDDHGGT